MYECRNCYQDAQSWALKPFFSPKFSDSLGWASYTAYQGHTRIFVLESERFKRRRFLEEELSFGFRWLDEGGPVDVGRRQDGLTPASSYFLRFDRQR